MSEKGERPSYIEILNAFWNFRREHYISHAAADLFYCILDYNNGLNWKIEITIPNSRIIGKIDISERNLIIARNTLIQHELISYKKGKKGQAGIYSLNLSTVKMYNNRYGNRYNNQYNNDVCNTVINDTSIVGESVLHKKEKNREIQDTEDIIPIIPTGEREQVPYTEIIELYNKICTKLPRCQTLSNARKKAIKARFKCYSLSDFEHVFELANASEFLTGGNNRNWVATFDWLVKESNFAKVFDGNYSNKTHNEAVTNSNYFLEYVRELERNERNEANDTKRNSEDFGSN